MSTIKDPKVKKRLSLSRDRRNTFRENNKSSRKNIRRGKQLQHMDERRSTREAIRSINGTFDEDLVAQVETLVKARATDSRRRGFKKQPDTALEIVLAQKKQKGSKGRR